MKANLPKKITDEIEMYDIIVGPGSKLSLITKYTPQNKNEDYVTSISKANISCALFKATSNCSLVLT